MPFGWYQIYPAGSSRERKILIRIPKKKYIAAKLKNNNNKGVGGKGVSKIKNYITHNSRTCGRKCWFFAKEV